MLMSSGTRECQTGSICSPDVGSGVPRDSPLEGHSRWDFASITSGKARSSEIYFVFRFV